MLLQMALFHSFLWLSNISLYIYHILFIHSPVNSECQVPSMSSYCQ